MDENEQKKDKKVIAKKIFRIACIVLVILWVIATIVLSFTVYAAKKILTQEAEENEDFWKLKMAIARCYLSEQKGLFGNGKELYQKYLYSSNCDADINNVKWIATKIELKGSNFNYEGYIDTGRKDKILIKTDDDILRKIIDGQENGSNEIIIYSEPELSMHYSVDEEIFKVEYINN